MHFPTLAKFVTIVLPLHALAQGPTSTFPGLGILQQMTPTVDANKVPITAIETLSADAVDFYQSYTDIDTFNFVSAQVQAINKDPKLAADINRLDRIYFEGEQSLLDDPKAYLSRLQSSASPWPKAFSKDILSQANGVLLGYKSIVSVDLLNAKDVPTVTPGIRVTEGAGGVEAPAATGSAASKAMGMPAATGNPQLVIAAAAAAAGMLGIIAL